MSYLDYLLDVNASESILLYTFIVFAVLFLGSFSQNKYRNSSCLLFRPIYFIIACFLLMYFSFFCDVGSDLEQYREIYKNSSFEYFLDDIFLEPGFKLICSIIKLLGVDEYVGIGILKCIVLSLVFISVYKLRNYLHIGLSLMAYTAIIYFMSFNVLRICFAASLVLLAWSYAFSGKNKITLVLLLVSCTIHYSAVVTFVPFIFLYLLRNVNQNLFDLLAILLSFSIIFLSEFFVNYLVSGSQYLNKYDGYLDSTGSFGLMQLVFYVPLFLLSYTLPLETTIRKVSITLVWSGFAIAMCGYSNGMISRMNVYFIYNYMCILPMAVNQLRLDKLLRIRFLKANLIIRCPYVLLFLFAFIYLFYKFYLETPVYFSISEIYPYKMWI